MDVKICDFGFARQRSMETITQSIAQQPAGTLPYMAPEVLIEGKMPQFASDVYSMGVAMVEWFTGRPAWNYPANMEEARRVLREKKAARAMPDAFRYLPEAVKDILAASILYEPTRRPTAAEMIKQLSQIPSKLIEQYDLG